MITPTTTPIYKIHTDGGARGNPGPAAIGLIIEDTHHHLVYQLGQTIGIATNNEAEYQALITALGWINTNLLLAPDTQLHFFLDSQLVVNQLNRLYKVKEPRLQLLHHQVVHLINSLPAQVSFSHIRRQLNLSADRLVNQALDAA